MKATGIVRRIDDLGRMVVSGDHLQNHGFLCGIFLKGRSAGSVLDVVRISYKLSNFLCEKAGFTDSEAGIS